MNEIEALSRKLIDAGVLLETPYGILKTRRLSLPVGYEKYTGFFPNSLDNQSLKVSSEVEVEIKPTDTHEELKLPELLNEDLDFRLWKDAAMAIKNSDFKRSINSRSVSTYLGTLRTVEITVTAPLEWNTQLIVLSGKKVGSSEKFIELAPLSPDQNRNYCTARFPWLWDLSSYDLALPILPLTKELLSEPGMADAVRNSLYMAKNDVQEMQKWKKLTEKEDYLPKNIWFVVANYQSPSESTV